MENSLIEKLSDWIKNSVTLKMAIIGIMVLMLLIPTFMIREIIREREQLSQEAIEEVSAKWSGRQQINGPVLTTPLIYEYEKDGETITSEKNWHLLPEYLKIEGEIVPEKLKRGIYEVVVYTSDISVTGDFELTKLFDQTDLKEIRYDQSYITIGLSDLRGIKNELDFSWDGQSAAVKPGTKLSNIAYSGITVELPDEGLDNEKSHKFSFKLKLRGSQNLSFVPLGSTTEVEISSDWDAPSFNGNFLPDWRNIDKDGFKARWKIFQLNRNLPQSWIDSDMSGKMNEAAFGFDLLLPLDDYQKSMRSAKYAGMTIALTFLVFFLVEVLNKRKIHPFQYILVGLALCIFYILLVSISEHTNFNFAYGISAFSIILMITMYSLSVFKKKMLSLLLIIILVGIYGFLYVTLQLADYALLMGSIGLVVILGITMYFTRKINWYKLNIEAD